MQPDSDIDRPNILLIVLDTVRAKNLSVYGYDRDTTPFFEEFSEQSITYERAYSPAPWTTPSHASMFTGTYVAEHQTDRDNERLTPDFPTLAELLGKHGYETVGFSNNAHVSPDFEFDRGFDTFVFNGESYNEPLDGGVSVSQIRSNVEDGPFHRQAAEAVRYVRENDGSLTKTGLNWLYRKGVEAGIFSSSDRGATSTNLFVEEFLDDRSDEPFFMFLNYMEGHAPYQAPDRYQYRYNEDPSVSDWWPQEKYFAQQADDQERKVSDLLDQYDGCIRYLDAMLEELVETLKRRDCLDDTLIVVTSDHGEAFGEWGLYEHKAGVYNELTRVPLFIKTTEQRSELRDEPVSCRWLFPTLLRAGGVSVPDHAVDADLLSQDRRPVVAESEGLPYGDDVFESSLPRKFASPHQGYVDGTQKLIRYETDDVELYDLEDESADAAIEDDDRKAQLCERLEAILPDRNRTARSDADREVEIADETLEHLHELGYR